MKASFLFFLICPAVLFAQHQQTAPVNGATDCPTFNKKNTLSKASMFQYMRTHKPQKNQQPIYRTNTAPPEKPAQIEGIATTSLPNEPASRKQKRVKNKSAVQPEEVVSVSDNLPKNDTDKNSQAESVAKPEDIINPETADVPAAKETKKVKNTLFKTRMKPVFKKRNKRTSRKNTVKCPQF